MYKDPFELNKEIPANLDYLSKMRLREKLERYELARQTEVFKNSVNAVQVHHGLKNNNWYYDKSVIDNSKAFVKRFDINGDGRLSARELILGSIYNNKSLLGTGDCKLCYEDLCDKLDGIFAYLDCNNDGLVGAEEIYKHLPHLRRDTSKWNFYNLASKAEIRTSVVNDFVLKNQNALNGKLNKSEFRMGILLGYWDRQTDDLGIVEDDRLNLKKLRWENEDTDIGAVDYIKSIALAKALDIKKKQDEAIKHRTNNQGVEVRLADGDPAPQGLELLT